MTVAFTSSRSLNRAENIKALYDFYDGEKVFFRNTSERLKNEKFDLVVTDEFLNNCKSDMIMIFHALAGGKTYGLDQPNPYYKGMNTEKLLYAITSSKDMVSLTAKQCGIPEHKVLPIGIPRTDLYFGKKKGDGETKYCDKKMYLYAPTFGTITYKLTNWDAIDRILNDDEILAIKPHPVTGDISNNQYFDHIEFVDPQEPSAPYLIDCDVCITDYSSIMFDAYILDKPVVLFEKDLGTFKHTRGMYLPYPESYSNYHARTEYALIEYCRTAVSTPEKYLNIISSCKGHSREAVVKLIERILGDKNE